MPTPGQSGASIPETRKILIIMVARPFLTQATIPRARLAIPIALLIITLMPSIFSATTLQLILALRLPALAQLRMTGAMILSTVNSRLTRPAADWLITPVGILAES